jgi:hypothetical protein
LIEKSSSFLEEEATPVVNQLPQQPQIN